jgi:hypothetical protein
MLHLRQRLMGAAQMGSRMYVQPAATATGHQHLGRRLAGCCTIETGIDVTAASDVVIQASQ